MEKEDVLFKIPDPKSIPCLTCKKGMHNFLEMYCVAFKVKPNEVYFDNAKCPQYEPIKK